MDERYGEARHWNMLPAWLKPPTRTAQESTLPAVQVPAALDAFFTNLGTPPPGAKGTDKASAPV